LASQCRHHQKAKWKMENVCRLRQSEYALSKGLILVWKQSFPSLFDDAKDSSQESRIKQVSGIKELFNQESRFK